MAAVSTSAAAFSMGPRAATSSFLGRAMLPQTRNKSIGAMSKIMNGGGRTTPIMLFGNFFGGGAFALTTDYAALDFPANELGEAATQGQVLVTSAQKPNLQLATFAGGCFWGLELSFQRLPGVAHTAVGYCQGPEKNPNYDQVCSGATGHTEAVSVYYDPKETTYEALLTSFFERVNPTTINGQGNDFGKQYRTGVYFHTKEQESIARAQFEQEQTKYSKPIATELEAAKPFWSAEDYHQQYLEKGGQSGRRQDASKGATETIRCYG
eukprot:CAMPEP_0198140570 /NCGR_PEP_ID=MMETSP1443-20131203/3721_1 /TAXON_ID=186043 /ORGANISM="Entomoneis sp., Strain CCMP2396" /LENGTH=266 /DNA_ID=CAMNT_0043803047 /DNA_START=148 /DNA_END=948 /DNA_ORIENTATION=-